MVGNGSCGVPPGRHAFETDGERYGPEWSIQTAIGALGMRCARERDRTADVPAEKKTRLTSGIRPQQARRSERLDVLPPVLSLRGLSLLGHHSGVELPRSTGQHH